MLSIRNIFWFFLYCKKKKKMINENLMKMDNIAGIE